MNIHSRYLTKSAMLIALAVLFPIVFHAVGLGAAFLPLFWPIAAAIFLLPLHFALIVSILAPLVSSLLTGMPPISPPILQVMIAELMAMVIVGHVFYHKFSFSTFWSLLMGLLASRIVLFFIVQLLAPLLGLPSQVFSIVWVTRGVPGILVILFFIPLLVTRLKHDSFSHFFQIRRQ